MTMDIVALAISAVISFIIPVIIFLCVLVKGKGGHLCRHGMGIERAWSCVAVQSHGF